MKVNVGIAAHNSADWPRYHAGEFGSGPAKPDGDCVMEALALGDMCEPLGYDGIWASEHCCTPYAMTPNPIQMLSYFAGRTESIELGTHVVVAPWWNPVRLAHQIAYLDIISRGRFTTIGIGRGVSKTEFEAVGVPREESRERFDETLEILELALSNERFSYDGKIFRIPETSVRPQPITKDLAKRFYGASATQSSLELNARRGLVPLFVGNKPLTDAAAEVKQVNTFRAEAGLPPCQPKACLFMYCAPTKELAERADDFIATANRDVTIHYGFGDPSTFAGIKGYEDYANRKGYATAVSAEEQKKAAPRGYDQSNLLVGTPDQIIEKIRASQEMCSFSEITIIPNFTSTPFDEAAASIKLFAEEVLPVVHKMDAPLHPAVLPEAELVQA